MVEGEGPTIDTSMGSWDSRVAVDSGIGTFVLACMHVCGSVKGRLHIYTYNYDCTNLTNFGNLLIM